MLVGWKVDVNHTSYVIIILTKCYVIPFTTKILCDLSKANRHYNNQMLAFMAKKLIFNMQIPCNDVGVN
jgi:hypothetical protein